MQVFCTLDSYELGIELQSVERWSGVLGKNGRSVDRVRPDHCLKVYALPEWSLDWSQPYQSMSSGGLEYSQHAQVFRKYLNCESSCQHSNF